MCAALAFKTNDSDRCRRHLLSSSKYNANLGPNRRYWGRNCRLCQRPILRFYATDFVHTLLICDKPVYENVTVKIDVVFLVCNRKRKRDSDDSDKSQPGPSTPKKTSSDIYNDTTSISCKRSVCDPLKLKMTPKVNYLGVTMTPENFFEGKTLFTEHKITDKQPL